VLGQQFRQMAFEYWNATVVEHPDLGFVIINTGDLVTHFRKANRSDESYISGPNNTD
jgi:hypothetical protein